MNSTSNKQLEDERKEEAIRRQIATLQFQLPSNKVKSLPPPHSPKRKREPGVLAPATPSPKKRKVAPKPDIPRVSAVGAIPALSFSKPKQTSSNPKEPNIHFVQPAPSKLVNKLAALSRASTSSSGPTFDATTRSTAFAAPAPAASTFTTREPEYDPGTIRDDSLSVIENLELGPIEHKPPIDDPSFERLEPYSGIHLKSRTTPHADIQEHMHGRYYLSPSTLYSIVRLAPNKQAYDVPVDGDYVIIAVVAERGPVRVSKAPVGLTQEVEDVVGDREEGGGGVVPIVPVIGESMATNVGRNTYQIKDKSQWKGKGKAPGGGPGPRAARKYVNLKLIDFGARSSSSATGGKAVIRGDAFLSLLLFESESVEDIVDPETKKKTRMYRGGSRGAFEHMATLREGSVVALLNPRVLRPFQRSADSTPHPSANILGITPESAESAVVIGHARDLGICAVRKKDGKPCGAWTDKRMAGAGAGAEGDVCEYHIVHAVTRGRATRAEFGKGTMGLDSASVMHRKKTAAAYDPSRQWGLRPEGHRGQTETDGGGATYVVQGHVVSRNSQLAAPPKPVGETVGREAQSRAKRKRGAREEKEVGKALDESVKGSASVSGSSRKDKGKGRGRSTAEDEEDDDDEDDSKHDQRPEAPAMSASRTAFSTSMIRTLGFDPTTRPAAGKAGPVDAEVKRKLNGLSAILEARKSIPVSLGPRPGKTSTTVRTPPRVKLGKPPMGSGPQSALDAASSKSSNAARGGIDLDSDSDDDDILADPADWAFGQTVKSGRGKTGPETSASSADEGLIDLDDSSDLEIEG